VETLADRIARDGPLNELDAVGWAIRLARRLEMVHLAGGTHGKVSPECVSTDGVDRSARGVLRDAGGLAHELGYQSPERVSGGAPSAADDAWGVMATLYTILTGSPPFAASTEEELRSKILGSVAPPLAVFDVGDDNLQQILDDALAREPERRIRTPETLRTRLERWHPDPTVTTLPPLESAVAALPAEPMSPPIVDEETVDLRSEPIADPGSAPPGAGVFKTPLMEDDDDEQTLLREAPALLSAVASATLARFGGAQVPPAPVHADPVKPLPAAGRPPDDPASVRTEPLPAVPAQGVSPQLEDEDDDEDMRTLMRPSLDETLRARMAVFGTPVGGTGPLSVRGSGLAQAGAAGPAPQLDDDEDMQTMLREAPPELQVTAMMNRPFSSVVNMAAPPPPSVPMSAPPPSAQGAGFPLPQQPAPPPYGAPVGAPYTPEPPYGGRDPFASGPIPEPWRAGGAGTAILVAILALIVAAGATFLYLRARASGGSLFGAVLTPADLSTCSCAVKPPMSTSWRSSTFMPSRRARTVVR